MAETLVSHPTPMQRDRATTAHDRSSLFGALSLERKLPLLMSGVLVAVLSASLALTYNVVSGAASARVREKLRTAGRQLASTAEAAVSQRARQLREVAARDDVRAALQRGDSAGGRLREALAPLVGSDSLVAAELWDGRGRRLVRIGRDAAGPLATRIAGTPRATVDSVLVGPMYAEGGQVYYWMATPVRAAGTPAGWLALQRRVTGPRDASRSLRELTGEEMALYIRNVDGSLWSSAPGVPAAAPVRRDSTAERLLHVRPGVGEALASGTAVAGTPFVVVLESPLSAAYAGPRRTALRLAALSLVLIAVGTVIAWLISRRVARPLGTLTVAAEDIARGEYARRVEVRSADEVGRLAASFNQMAEEIERGRRELEHRMVEAEDARSRADDANRAKSQFLATMSHELRTPLNAIAGYADLLALGVYGPVNDPQRDALARITRSQLHLLRLINDVLHFAQLSAGRVAYAIGEVRVEAALAELEVLVAPQVRTKRLRFTLLPGDPMLAVRADREKLQQIVLNLLSNAIKFTPEEGTVVLEFDGTPDVVHVRVRDSGVGIPPDRMPTVFDAFVQVDRALNRPNEGVGLGLAISRDLARAMGGDLTVTSAMGRGTTFTLTLPAWRESSAGRSTPEGPLAALR